MPLLLFSILLIQLQPYWPPYSSFITQDRLYLHFCICCCLCLVRSLGLSPLLGLNINIAFSVRPFLSAMLLNIVTILHCYLVFCCFKFYLLLSNIVCVCDVLGCPRNLFRFFCTEKLKGTFWATQCFLTLFFLNYYHPLSLFPCS